MERSLESLLYGTQFRKLIEKEFLFIQKEYGLCRIDIQILRYLCSAGEHNTSRDIMELNLFTKGHVSQSLNRLQKQGLVAMFHDSKDRRLAHIILTDSADEMMNRIKGAYEKINNTIFDGITVEEKQSLMTVVQKLNRNIENAVEAS